MGWGEVFIFYEVVTKRYDLKGNHSWKLNHNTWETFYLYLPIKEHEAFLLLGIVNVMMIWYQIHLGI